MQRSGSQGVNLQQYFGRDKPTAVAERDIPVGPPLEGNASEVAGPGHARSSVSALRESTASASLVLHIMRREAL